MLVAEGVQRPAFEGEPAGDHLEEDDAEGVEVGADIDGPGVAELLGGHVGPRAQPGAGAGQTRVEGLDGETYSLVSLSTVVGVRVRSFRRIRWSGRGSEDRKLKPWSFQRAHGLPGRVGAVSASHARRAGLDLDARSARPSLSDRSR